MILVKLEFPQTGIFCNWAIFDDVGRRNDETYDLSKGIIYDVKVFLETYTIDKVNR